MTNPPSPTPSPSPDPTPSDANRILEKESLGEYFRKRRISNRVDIPKMAKETRLAAEYLQAIEKNEFDKLPGETYRKIFIKSVAKYLELDPEEMFARYLRETHIEPAPEAAPAEPLPRKSETRSSAVLSQSASMRPLLITLGAIFVVLLVILSRTGPSDTPPQAFPSDTAPGVFADSAPPIDTTVFAPAPPESLLPLSESSVTTKAAPAPMPPPPADSEAPNVEIRRFMPETEGSFKVELLCTRDSVYVNAYRIEKSWFNLFRKGEHKVFAGDTAIWFRISTPEWVTLRSGTTDMVPAPLKNKPVLRVDAEGITYHPVKAWDRLLRQH